MKMYQDCHFSKLYLEALTDYLSMSPPVVPSRLGPVRDIGPAILEMDQDGNRVLILKRRRLNPFFALAEASWVLAGRRDAHPLSIFISRISDLSDDGVILHGAYGFRIRHRYGQDQLEMAIKLLREDVTSRRVAINLWDVEDLGSTSKDLPCNVMLFIKVREGKLCLTVCNRSNDLYLGVPYDVVTFSIIQRYIAGKLGLPVEAQVHFTDSLHVYESDRENIEKIANTNRMEDISYVSPVPYETHKERGIWESTGS